jgi:hypothetical protein
VRRLTFWIRYVGLHNRRRRRLDCREGGDVDADDTASCALRFPACAAGVVSSSVPVSSRSSSSSASSSSPSLSAVAWTRCAASHSCEKDDCGRVSTCLLLLRRGLIAPRRERLDRAPLEVRDWFDEPHVLVYVNPNRNLRRITASPIIAEPPINCEHGKRSKTGFCMGSPLLASFYLASSVFDAASSFFSSPSSSPSGGSFSTL